MKRLLSILLPFILILGFIIPIQPANAIFGLSKCEKVKKEIQKNENQINSDVYYWKLYLGKIIPLSLESKLKKDLASPLLNDIWRTGFNNPNCFTRSQNLQIKELKKWSMGLFLQTLVTDVFKDGKCQEMKYWLKHYDECKIRRGWIITEVLSLPSLYFY